MDLASGCTRPKRVTRCGSVLAVLATSLVCLLLAAPAARAHGVHHNHSRNGQPLPQWLTYLVFLGGPALPIVVGGVLLRRELRRTWRDGSRPNATSNLTERTI